MSVKAEMGFAEAGERFGVAGWRARDGPCGHARGHPENLDMRLRFPVRRGTLRKDAVAGLVLGVESVPDGLAAGLLAGVSPL